MKHYPRLNVQTSAWCLHGVICCTGKHFNYLYTEYMGSIKSAVRRLVRSIAYNDPENMRRFNFKYYRNG